MTTHEHERETNERTTAVATLRKLLAVVHDGITGYREAAASVKSHDVHGALAGAAAEREEIAAVLTYELSRLGEKAGHHGSVLGALHRGWLFAVATAERGDPGAVLHACERGEHEAVEAFVSALGLDLPGDVRSVVQSQLGRLLAARESLARIEQDIGSSRKSDAPAQDPRADALGATPAPGPATTESASPLPPRFRA